MTEIELTCGEGLAAQSVLPAKVGELIAAMADVLELHATALDLEDENARREYDAYRQLTETHREAAIRLRAAAEQMESSRGLAAAAHDAEVMRSSEVAAVFERFVGVEEELLDLLRERVRGDRTMLTEMRGAD